MEAIKCPNCGSEKVQELTEEKYVCLACDNVFLVHNLSKEFQKTDEHIDEVHQDIIKKLDELKENSGGANDVQLRYKNAFHLIEIGEYGQAQQAFNILCEQYSMNYMSWYGLILLATNNLNDEQSWDVLLEDDFWDVVAKMRKCEDYPQEVEKQLREFFDGFKDTSNVNYIKEQIEALRAKVLELGEKAIKTINIARWIILVLVEWLVLGRTFAGIMKSVSIITAPLPDAAAEEAGSQLGRAILNFFAIPVKAIIGIVAMYLIYVFIRYIYEQVMEKYWNRSEEKLVMQNPIFQEALKQAGEWFGNDKKSQELLKLIDIDIDNRTRFGEKLLQQIEPDFIDSEQ